MELVKILMAAIVGTTLMTVFSYLIGGLFRTELGEPKLLNKLLGSSKWLHKTISEKSIIGWVLHYLIGFVFTGTLAVYFFLSENKPTIWMGALLGSILGLIGVLGWLGILGFHGSPPKIEWKLFLVQLVAAHIVFGIGATFVFKLYSA